MYKKLLTILFPLIIFASIAAPVLAQSNNRLRGNECLYGSVVTLDCVPVLFANAVYWLFIMSGVVAVFLIAYGGIKYLTSSGEAKAVESARKVITWAIIGLIIIISSFMIVNIIAGLTEVKCITKFGFTACGDASRDIDVTRYCENCVRYPGQCGENFKVDPGGASLCPESSPVCCVKKVDYDPTRYCANCVRYPGQCGEGFYVDPEGASLCSDTSPICCVER